MAVSKYAGEEAVTRISEYVNKKLTVVSTVPTSPTELRSIFYVGPTTADYVQGCVYLYDEDNDEWVLTDLASLHETSWTGTQEDYWAMSADERARYEIVNFTDDFVEGGEGGLVVGYYYNEKFYEDAEHTIEITGAEGYIYEDLTEHALYVFNETTGKYIAVGGNVEFIVRGYYYEGQFYKESSHTTLITPDEKKIYVDLEGNTIYRYDASESKYISIGGGSNYTAGFGISIEDDEIKTTDFVGTQAEWDALTDDQKVAYDFVHITDDSSEVIYSPGHVISDGTSEKTQREILEFEGFTVTDDSVNGKTKVAEVPYTAGDGVEITEKEISVSNKISRTWTGTKVEWDAISDKSIYDGWIINITDDQASGVGVVVDTVEEGNMNAVTSNAVYDEVDSLKVKPIDISDIFTANAGFSIYAADAYEQGGIVTLNVSVNATTAATSGNIGYVNSSYVPTDCFGKVIGAGLARLTSMTTGAAYPLGSWLMSNGQVYVQTTTASGGFSVHLQWRKP